MRYQTKISDKNDRHTDENEKSVVIMCAWNTAVFVSVLFMCVYRLRKSLKIVTLWYCWCCI